MSASRGSRYVCQSCIAQLRRHRRQRQQPNNGTSGLTSMLSSSSSSSRALSTTGFARLRSRKLLALYGHDAAHFLQGLTTANIPTSGLLSSPSNPQVLYSAFMNAQGRLLHDVFIYPIHPQHALREAVAGGRGTEAPPSDPVFLIEVDAEQAKNLYAFLRKYKLRAKVTMRLVEETELGVYAAWSGGQENIQGGGSGAVASTTAGHDEGSKCLVTLDPRIPGPWHRIVAFEAEASSAQELLRAPARSELEYKVNRYLNGVPEGQKELPREETLLHEANIDLMHGVDFRKGCYVGQELVIRTQHTGVVRKRIMPVQVWANDAPSESTQDQDGPVFTEEGAMASRESTQEADLPSPLDFLVNQNFKSQGAKRPDGKLIGVAGNVGLALCRLERVIETEDSVAVGKTKLLSLDLSGAAGAEGVSAAWLRPFVPAWWQERGKIMEGGYESLKVLSPGKK